MSNQEQPVIVALNKDAKEKTPFEHTIDFKYRSEIDGKDYTGRFTYRKLTLGGLGKISAIRIRLNGGNPDDVMDPGTYTINNAIAHLSVWFENQTDLPEWARDFTKIYDANIVLALHKEGISFEESFRKKAVG